MEASPTNQGTTGPEDELSREQVVALFRDLESDALRRHTALVGSDGSGTLKIICGCECPFGAEEWIAHLRAIVETARYPKKPTR
jgi:hypothetical protein